MSTLQRATMFVFLSVPWFLSTSNLDAATITAASCSVTDVQSAVNSASDGDTVNVPPGNCTWSTGIVVSKQISIIGSTNGCPSACDGASTINVADGITAVRIQANGVRVSGFTFVGEGTAFGLIDVHKTGGGLVNWRIDHCHFKNVGQKTPANRSINVGRYGGITENIRRNFPGLIDNNYFSGTKQNKAIQVYGGSGTYTSWNDTLTLGGPDFLFIEDNRFDFEIFTDGVGCFDSDCGGRFVFRYNWFHHCWITAHGQEQISDIILPWRSTHGWEIYNNVWEDDKYYWIRANMRGGTGVIYNNAWNLSAKANVNIPFLFQYQRGDYAATCNSDKACNGSNITYDGNEDASGYPCYQQIGMTGANGITKFPVYEWNNYWQGVACGSPGYECFGITYSTGCPTQHVQFGRDIIKNGTVPKPGYTAYRYPHPLRAGAGDVSPPRNLRIQQ